MAFLLLLTVVAAIAAGVFLVLGIMWLVNFALAHMGADKNEYLLDSDGEDWIDD